ncbi:MAG: DPP IV N-terminal domain-containing protein [Bacteroidales bacterium]|nr:DPP IV N-terminal domain-containing protein [Bacteroidales bacterium]
MRTKPVRLITALLISGMCLSGVAYGQYGSRGGYSWVDDTHYTEMQKGKDGKDVKMSVDVLTGKAKPYAEKTRAGVKPGVSVTVKDGELYYSDGTTAPLRQITANPGTEVNPRLSPDQKKVAFTRDNDLYVIDLETNLEHRLTTDGTNLIYNGYASWVYFEEILGRGSQYCAFYWSPDSKKIAFLRFDDTEVPLYILMRGDSLHGAPEYTRYPVPGDPNPKVKLGFADLETGKLSWAKFDYQVDQYIAWPTWKPDSKEMMIQVLNRDQNHMQFFMVTPETGDLRKIYDEQRPTWVDFFEDIYALSNGSGFIINSYRNDWHNLYYHNWDGKQLAHLTDVKWRVSGITKVDEAKGIVYFTGRPESTENHLFSVKLDGTGMTQLTEGAGTHRASLSPDGSYLIDSWNSVMVPGRKELRDKNGKLVRLLSETKLEFDPAKNQRSEYVRIPSTDGFMLPAVITYPVNFDATKKYPVVFTIYGGPDAGSVTNSFNGYTPRWFAQNGIITINIDHRASGQFGKKGIDYMWRNLGKWEMVDYGEAVKWLRTKPYVDATKMGITGGSYGGYTTCMALTAGADYWTHGMALYSVTDWGLYDNIYTERFMDTPQQNPEGYKNGTAMRYASQLKGKLFIVHGEMDDNVHMQNSIQLISKLQDLNKEFQFMMYPNGRHGWGGPKAQHVAELQNKFWLKEFFGK